MAVLIDSHLHLARPEFDEDRDTILGRAQAAGVGAWLHVGFDDESIQAALALAADDPFGWATAGIHPHDATSYDDQREAHLTALGEAGKIVAIGECGLDYFRDLSPRDVQREVFARQIDLAKRLDLPMVFHVRDAYDDARALLTEVGSPPRRGVFHAFAGDGEFARWAVGEGFRLGIGGPLTYKKSQVPEAIEGLPASAFLLETDAPWLPPQPWRGKRNEPAYLRFTADHLAQLVGLELDALADQVAHNFCEVFGVTLPGELSNLRPSECPAPVRKKP